MSTYSPLGVEVSDVLGVALVGGILYIVSKSGIFQATNTVASVVGTAGSVVKTAGGVLEEWIKIIPTPQEVDNFVSDQNGSLDWYKILNTIKTYNPISFVSQKIADFIVPPPKLSYGVSGSW